MYIHIPMYIYIYVDQHTNIPMKHIPCYVRTAWSLDPLQSHWPWWQKRRPPQSVCQLGHRAPATPALRE